jgi:hypothetical protein
MSTISLTARGPATVEARPSNGTLVVKIGDAVISMDPADARQLGEDLMAAAEPSCGESISGPVIAVADRANDAVRIMVGDRVLLDLSATAWASLAMQGSSAALELKRNDLRVGLRSAQLQRVNADLAEASA